MRNLHVFLLIAIAILSFNVHARQPVPIVNHADIAVFTNSGTTPDVERVKQAITMAAGIKAWSVVPQSDHTLVATLIVRGKHTIVVEIAYSAEKYSLTYKDSNNMKFGQRDGQAVIHPYYNRWVDELKEAIRIELLKA